MTSWEAGPDEKQSREQRMLVKAKLFSIMERGIWETNLAKNFFFMFSTLEPCPGSALTHPGQSGIKEPPRNRVKGSMGAYSPPGPPGQGPKFLPRSRDPFSYDLEIKGIYSPEGTSQGAK